MGIMSEWTFLISVKSNETSRGGGHGLFRWSGAGPSPMYTLCSGDEVGVDIQLNGVILPEIFGVPLQAHDAVIADAFEGFDQPVCRPRGDAQAGAHGANRLVVARVHIRALPDQVVEPRARYHGDVVRREFT